MKKALAFLSLYLFLSCSTSISTKLVNKSFEKLNDVSKIVVLEENEELPINSEFVGDVKIGDSGFTTDCDYNKVISDAKNEAQKAGANLVKVIKLKKPTALGSTCYRLKAKMYRNLNDDQLLTLINKRQEKNKSRLPADADYALIHFYRPVLGSGALLYYSIKDNNDSVVGKLENGRKFVYKTKKFGDQTFYARLETKEEIKINVEKGKEYFVRCAIKMGVAVGRPVLDVVENHKGIEEFNSLK
ncbi:hypothetical protein [Flavobacterium terrae]|uniref:Lipoprotein n=1 Tax=Flavobacterium terrae TaxID=415425 RepID=A0A1M6A811_9FLAO|nr:hypothetical protein [Flavobacterium terrae]SHI32559.1 hypothetical protein SAMN05444363_0066 [Flavobacterium terrae]